MSLRHILVVVCLALLAGWGRTAMGASPWDGEWEGEIKQPRLTCSPCKIRMTVQDGVPNIRGDVSIQTFTIDGAGQVNAFVILQIGYAADCSLRGRISGDTLTASGRCVGSRVETPELTLRRVSGGSVGVRPPGGVAPTPSPGPSTRATPSPSPSPTPSPSPRPPSGSEDPRVTAGTIPPITPSTFGAGTQPLRLGEFAYGPQLSMRIGELQTGNWLTSCGAGQKTPLSRSLIPNPNTGVIHALFDRALKANGYSPTQGTPSYLVVGRIVDLNLVHCLREGTNPPQFSGSGSITVEWEVMTATGRRGIYSTTTSGSITVPSSDRRTDGVAFVVLSTFNEAFARLAVDPGFRNAVAQFVPTAAAGDLASRTVIRPRGAMTGSITANMKEILPAIVEVKSSRGLGSGFVVDASGLIITNAHVVGDDDSVGVRFDVSDVVQGTVVKRDRVRDVALIKVSRAGLKSLPLRSGKPTLTERVYAVGSPLGLSQTVSEGIVSAYRAEIDNGLAMIQATAPISTGNSGGPLLDASGNVIGISTFYARSGQNLNFFIPIDSALQFLELRVAGR